VNTADRLTDKEDPKWASFKTEKQDPRIAIPVVETPAPWSVIPDTDKFEPVLALVEAEKYPLIRWFPYTSHQLSIRAYERIEIPLPANSVSEALSVPDAAAAEATDT